MKVVDPGHVYYLDCFDGKVAEKLQFVKRQGEKYPGNTSSYPGTNIQEVLRACIDRVKYLEKQIPANENAYTIRCLQGAIWWLEVRAAKRHNRTLQVTDLANIDQAPTCRTCGHIECQENH